MFVKKASLQNGQGWNKINILNIKYTHFVSPAPDNP